MTAFTSYTVITYLFALPISLLS